MKISRIIFLAFLFVCAVRCEAIAGSPRWNPPAQRSYWVQQRLKEQQLAIEYEAVNSLFQKKFNKKERAFFNKLCWIEYALGYYNTLVGFTHHKTEVEHFRKEAEETLQTLRQSGTYRNILRKAKGKTKEYLPNYLMHRAETGKNDAWRRNKRNAAAEQLQRNDLFHLESGKKIYYTDDSVKSGIGLVVVVIAAVILGLMGALYLPKKPVFRNIRTILEH